jgi:hypothetical protein
MEREEAKLRKLLTVEGLFRIFGWDLVAPFKPLEHLEFKAWDLPVPILVRRPDGSEVHAEASIRPVFGRPSPIDNPAFVKGRCLCVFRGIEEAEIPIGSEIFEICQVTSV